MLFLNAFSPRVKTFKDSSLEATEEHLNSFLQEIKEVNQQTLSPRPGFSTLCKLFCKRFPLLTLC